MNNNEKEFIKELEALSRKYKLVIGGCGCCGSPWINPKEPWDESHSEAIIYSAESGYMYEDQLDWTYPGDYKWDDNKDKVVK